MADAVEKSNSPDPQPDSTVLEAMAGQVIVEVGSCPKCHYNLRGLRSPGSCPECGQPFTAESILTVTYPSAAELCWRFGWPIGVLLCCQALLLAGDEASSLGWFLLSFLMLFVIFINAIVQCCMLVRRHVRGSRRPVWVLGRAVVACVAVSLVLPFVIFGGCVFVFVHSLH
jgi:hypothetical protein